MRIAKTKSGKLNKLSFYRMGNLNLHAESPDLELRDSHAFKADAHGFIKNNFQFTAEYSINNKGCREQDNKNPQEKNQFLQLEFFIHRSPHPNVKKHNLLRPFYNLPVWHQQSVRL